MHDWLARTFLVFRSNLKLLQRLNQALHAEHVLRMANAAERKINTELRADLDASQKLIDQLRFDKVALANSCRSYKAANTTYREVIGVLRNMLKGKIADREQIKILTDHIAVHPGAELDRTEADRAG